MNVDFTNSIRRIVELLVNGNYDKIVEITNRQRLETDVIKRAIQDYGRTLIMPPNEAFDQLDVVEVTHAIPRRWSVRMNLWTAEEGRSDLSLNLTIAENGEKYRVELDDIHVL